MDDNRRRLESWLAGRAETQGRAVRSLAHAMGVTSSAIYSWASGKTPSRRNAANLDTITGGAVPKGEW